MAAKHIESKQYDLDKNQLIEKVQTAIEKSGFKLKDVNDKVGEIKASTKANIWSWSEEILIQINDNGTVEIKSECAMPLQIIDWGKNKRNVRKIFTFLD